MKEKKEKRKIEKRSVASYLYGGKTTVTMQISILSLCNVLTVHNNSLSNMTIPFGGSIPEMFNWPMFNSDCENYNYKSSGNPTKLH